MPHTQINTSSEIDNLTQGLSNISLSNMTTLTAAKEIAHTLKTFTGNSDHLEFFISSVDKFYNRYYTGTVDESLKEFVFASICSKLTEEAGDFLLCRPDLTSWPKIKDALRQRFGDRINRQVLAQQLNFLTRFKKEPILDFIERLKLLKSRISLKIAADDSLNQDTKTALMEQTELTAVTVLMSNSPSELRTILMLNNPKNIDDASAVVLNHSLIEQQINARTFLPRQELYQIPQNRAPPQINNRQNFSYIPPPIQQSFFNPLPMPNNNVTNNRIQPQYSSHLGAIPKQPFPSQSINIQPQPVRQYFPTNEQVFGKPKNVFSKENSNKLTSPPTPMSTTSRMPSAMSRNTDVHMRSIQSRNIQRQNPRNRHLFPQNQYPFTDLAYLADNPSESQQEFEYFPEEHEYQNCSEPPEYYEETEHIQNYENTQDLQEQNFYKDLSSENPS